MSHVSVCPEEYSHITTGCSLWVVIMVALRLALGQQATAATECARAIPLPAEVHLIQREGERFELTGQNRFDTEVYTRVSGNPKGY
jgi:hypothetical protein